MNEERNDLQKMITQALEEIKEAEGEKFDLDKINLALVSRMQIPIERSACSGGTAHPFRFKRRETPL